jgi:hypothetical protein
MAFSKPKHFETSDSHQYQRFFFFFLGLETHTSSTAIGLQFLKGSNNLKIILEF